MSALFDKVTKNKKGCWTIEEMRILEKSVVKILIAYHPGSDAKTRLPPEVLEKIKRKGWNEADNVTAIRVYGEKNTLGSAHILPVTHLVTNGGVIIHSPQTVTLMTVTKETVSRPNEPIPAAFEDQAVRSNIVAFTAMAGQLVKCDKGEWKADVRAKEFSQVFASSIDVAELTSLAMDVAVALNEDSAWKSMTASQKNGMDGARAAVFMRAAFDRMESLTYNYFNTRIVVKVLRAFVQVKGGWSVRKQVDANGTRVDVVPTSCYEVRKPTKEDARFKSQFPGIYWYKGGFRPTIVQPKTVSLAAVETIYKSVSQVVGGPSRMSSLLALQRDFSGLQDDIGKRLAFFLSATLSCWSMGRSVSIDPKSLGDIPPLKSSLTYWHRHLSETKLSLFANISSVDWKIIVSDNASYSRNQDRFIVQAPVPGSVYIAVVSTSFALNTRNSDIPQRASNAIPPCVAGSMDYILWTDVWGPYVFKETRKEYDNLVLEQHHRESKVPYVYGFSNSLGMRGILSSFADFSLLGWGVKTEKAKDGSLKITSAKEVFVPVPLQHYATERSWITRVLIDAGVVLSAWLNPMVRYSPISNLVWVNRSAVELHTNLVEQEDGQAFFPVLSRQSEPVLEDKLVSDWDLAEGEEQALAPKKKKWQAKQAKSSSSGLAPEAPVPERQVEASPAPIIPSSQMRVEDVRVHPALSSALTIATSSPLVEQPQPQEMRNDVSSSGDEVASDPDEDYVPDVVPGWGEFLDT